eukprot:261911-Amphidinium_carterae.1
MMRFSGLPLTSWVEVKAMELQDLPPGKKSGTLQEVEADVARNAAVHPHPQRIAKHRPLLKRRHAMPS